MGSRWRAGAWGLAFLVAGGVLLLSQLHPRPAPITSVPSMVGQDDHRAPPPSPPPSSSTDHPDPLVQAACRQIGVTTIYDPVYVRIPYPKGDVAIERGVCCDVVIRAFRAIGLDLQQAIHEDMTASFAAYPKKWGLRKPDPHIDHRRVLNLMTWFSRQGWAQPLTTKAGDYAPGDVVCWDLGNSLVHIGLVVATGEVVHNIGRGAQRESVLFAWKIIGHYRRPPP